ncbi:MAG: amidohydrolase [candidate division Zixibacteria bacterium]
MKRKSIFINGTIYTFQKKNRIEALAAENGVITEVGSNAELKSLARRGYKVIDLKGKCVIPGMIDSHLHMLGLGNLFSRVNLDGIGSLDKVGKILKKAALKLKKDQWLRGRGWDKNLWGEDFPDKSVLDNITDNPIALNSKDGHLIWVNSAALKICGITNRTADPSGGMILKNSSGEPTGILQENAVNLITDKIPAQSYYEKMDAILAAQKHLLKLGIIGAGDCDTHPTLISKYKELEKGGKLNLRIFKMIDPDDLDFAEKFNFRTGVGSEHFRTGCLKLFADGALGSQTAYMFKPYIRTKGNVGIETLTPGQLDDLVSRAEKIGIAVATHAIGDKANFQVLQAYSKLSSRYSERGLRLRIEHAQILRKKDIPLFAKHGIIASMQPIHATSDRDISDRYLGARGRYAYPFKTLLQSGATLAFGSDAPIETADPFAGIHAAVTRKRAGESRKAWYPEEKLTVRQALRAYTAGAATACCYDDITGDIAVGKRADFAVISDDIFKIKPDKIHGVENLATIIDGKIVYGRNNLR